MGTYPLRQWKELVDKEYQGSFQGEEYLKAKLLAAIADALENIQNEIYTWRRWEKGDMMVE